MASSVGSPVKVAVLDDYQGFAAPHFQALDPASFEVTIFRDTLLPYNHPGTPQGVKDELVKRLEPFAIICTTRERTPFPGELISRLPNLKLLLTNGLRNASLDLDACRERGIPVAGSSSPSDSTTQHCVALILALARNIVPEDASVKSGGWQTSSAITLAGKVFGTIGLGRLGLATAKIMHQAFGMKVIAWSSNLTQEAANEKASSAGLPVHGPDGEATLKVVGKEELFRTADVVSVHLVLSDRSRGVIGAGDLALMKSEALFVNTSRGPLVVEKDLLGVLKAGKIRAAALDVFDLEPLPLDSEWRTAAWGKEGRSHVLLSPHMGYVTKDTLDSWYQQQLSNINKWANGESLDKTLY